MISLEERCQERIFSKGRRGGFDPRRCYFRAVKDGYCKKHHPDTIQLRQEESIKRFQKKIEQTRLTDPNISLMKARIEIEKLKEENRLLKEQLKNQWILQQIVKTIQVV